MPQIADPAVNAGVGGVTPSASGVMTYNEWIHQPEQAHFAYSPFGSTQAYKEYLAGITKDQLADAANSANYNGFDVTGYSQAGWDLEKTRELLEEQRAFNSSEAAKNREWQERMSNTAYQRAVEDLKAAGLNKWLAVTGGNGASASTPSGSSATSSSGDAATPSPELYKAIIQALTSIATSAIKLLG